MANGPLLFSLALCAFLARFYLVVLTRSKRSTRGEREKCSLGVFLGSGNAHCAPNFQESFDLSDF